MLPVNNYRFTPSDGKVIAARRVIQTISSFKVGVRLVLGIWSCANQTWQKTEQSGYERVIIQQKKVIIKSSSVSRTKQFSLVYSKTLSHSLSHFLHRPILYTCCCQPSGSISSHSFAQPPLFPPPIHVSASPSLPSTPEFLQRQLPPPLPPLQEIEY